MMQSIDSQDNKPGSIKQFVRDILGCTCPDSVFEQIEDRRAQSAASPHNRAITVGGRLLIYIWEVDDSIDLRQGIAAMLAAGREERDARGLNRFRAVLGVDSPGVSIINANHYFSQFEDLDDRMHIHVVSADVLKGF